MVNCEEKQGAQSWFLLCPHIYTYPTRWGKILLTKNSKCGVAQGQVLSILVGSLQDGDWMIAPFPVVTL